MPADAPLAGKCPVIGLWFWKGDGLDRQSYVPHSPAFAVLTKASLPWAFPQQPDMLWVCQIPHRDIFFLPLKL